MSAWTAWTAPEALAFCETGISVPDVRTIFGFDDDFFVFEFVTTDIDVTKGYEVRIRRIGD